MPPPANDQATKDVRVVTWPLFNSKGVPALEEVKQAPNLANCPVAAILAAYAFTAQGRTFITGIVSETAATVVTDLSKLPANTLANPPAGGTLTSARYFTVKLPGGSIEVSDVLYTDDADAGWSLIYLRDPSDKSLWAAVIEKALAVALKSYENFDAKNIAAEEFWRKVTGAKPTVIAVTERTPLGTILEAARNSTRVPTIGASKAEKTQHVTEFHGFAMMGLQGQSIRLYDAAKAKKLTVTAEQFRGDFQAILHQA
jgi:hypothetical protein